MIKICSECGWTGDVSTNMKMCPDCHWSTLRPATNFDYIKLMDIDSMATYLNSMVNTGACNDFGIKTQRKCDGDCLPCIKEWLEMPKTATCIDCKYFMWGSCLHKESAHCNHHELWTPIDFGEYNISMFNIPKDIEDMIKMGIYTEEEIVEFIRRH